ncbi:MAG: hypothetical protein ACLUHK_06330 [Eubacteriales bacterium]|jgi:hypothetical protein
MLTLNQIREDLKEIRYYYSRKEMFDEHSGNIAPNAVLDKVRKYNEAVKTAPPQLYDVYICLYVKNYTQEGMGDELGYTLQHINVLNKRLLLFLQSVLQDEGENGDEK